MLSPLTYTLIVFTKHEVSDSVQKMVDEYGKIIAIKAILNQDGNQKLFKKLGGIKTEACYLVRPDMHIAWRSNGYHAEALRHILQKLRK